MFLPEFVRKQAFSDPETRAKLKAEFAEKRYTNFHKRWDLIPVVEVAKPENERYLGKTIAELGEMRRQDPVDAMIDLSLEEDLKTTFLSANGGDPEAMGQIMRSPYVLIGVSDAGAHVQFNASFGYSTTLLGLHVRERGAMPLEQAIYKLTFQVASVYGLNDRGLLRPGYAADVCVFNPETVRARDWEWVQDYPANTRRLAQKADGIEYTIVNGTVIYEGGRLTGALPGHVLRGSAYAGRPEPGGREILVTMADGELFAFARQCPHEATNLDTAEVMEGLKLRCEGHNYCFDLRTGECVTPAGGPALAVLPLEEHEGKVCVRLEW
jgi:N-acyl-D-aspartate/D-glutamate deacylase